MSIDSSKLYRARIPLTALMAVLALGAVFLMFPSSSSSEGGGPAEIESGAVQVTVGPDDVDPPSRTTEPADGQQDDQTVTTAVEAPDTDTVPPKPLEMAEPIGGVRPEWPEWAVVSNESPSAARYSAEVTLKGKSVEELLVWLSMQNWVLNADSASSPTWALSAGSGDSTFSGVLEVTSPSTCRITLQRS